MRIYQASDPYLIASAWRELTEGVPRPPNDWSRKLAKVAREGWILEYELEALIVSANLVAFSSRSVRQILSTFDIEVNDHVSLRPARRARDAFSSHGISAAALAVLLTEFQAMGFPVDPQPLVAALLPDISRRRVVTWSELQVWWYEDMRGRGVTVMEYGKPFSGKPLTHTTPAGYQLSAWTDGERVTRIQSKGPRRGLR